jgi:hypothetical protein
LDEHKSDSRQRVALGGMGYVYPRFARAVRAGKAHSFRVSRFSVRDELLAPAGLYAEEPIDIGKAAVCCWTVGRAII